jgi:hypothetical protein
MFWGTIREHSENIRGNNQATFRERPRQHSENLWGNHQGTFGRTIREHSGNVCRNLEVKFRERSGEQSGNIQRPFKGTFRQNATHMQGIHHTCREPHPCETHAGRHIHETKLTSRETHPLNTKTNQTCVRSRRLFSAPSAPTLLLPLFDWSNRLRKDPAVTPVPSEVLAEDFEEFALEELSGCNICRNSKPMGYSPLVPVEPVPLCSLFWLARCWLASMLGSNADRSSVSSSSSESSEPNFRTAPSPRSLASAWPCVTYVSHLALVSVTCVSHLALAPCYICLTLCTGPV